MELRQNGQWHEVELGVREQVIGIYGEVYKSYSGARLKSLGLYLK